MITRTSLTLLASIAAEKALQAIAHFDLCMRIARERRHLRVFDARALKDMGLSRADALREAGRSFWDVPSHRRAELARKAVSYRLGDGSVPLIGAPREETRPPERVT